jgi:osmotically-inducible protein OsmY
LFANVYTGMGSSTGFSANGRVGTSGRGGYGTTGAATGASTAPNFVTTVGFDAPRIAPTRMQTEVSQALANSTALAGSKGIKVAFDRAGNVLLTGQVASDHDRLLAEGLVRMTPGVHEVRNELQVPNAERVPPPVGQ